MPKPIIVQRQEGDIKTVAAISATDDKFGVAEICFNGARPAVMLEASHRYGCIDDLNYALQEMYMGIDDERLPADIQALPIGRREDYVRMFNEEIYWYWKKGDPDYDENLPLHQNAVRYASGKALAYITPDAEASKSESVEQKTEQVDAPTPLKEDGVGFVQAGQITENSSGGYDVPLQIIEAGWSLNGNYYTQEAVADIARLVCNKTPGYFNHGDHNRNPRDWNLVIESGVVDGNTVQGTAHIFQYPDGEALKERIDYVVENNALHLFGVSIDAWAKVEEGERDGREGCIVTAVVAMSSVDVVMTPAANGRWANTTESATSEAATTTRQEQTTMDRKTLKAEHPDLTESLIDEGRKEVRSTELAEATAAVKTLTDEKAALETVNAELQVKVDAQEKQEAADAFRAKVVNLTDTELPEALRTEAFVGSLVDLGEDKWVVIEGLVADRKTLNIAGPKDMGKDEEKTKTKESLTEQERKDKFLQG